MSAAAIFKPDRRPVISCADLATLDDDEIMEGFRDGYEGFPCGENRSRSYWHGWRNAQRDKGRREGDWADALLARDYCPGGNINHGLRRIAEIRKMWADIGIAPNAAA